MLDASISKIIYYIQCKASRVSYCDGTCFFTLISEITLNISPSRSVIISKGNRRLFAGKFMNLRSKLN